MGLAVQLENRYKGVRSPHKFKGGVSGCVRECAEAQGKDFGVIATDKGWNSMSLPYTSDQYLTSPGSLRKPLPPEENRRDEIRVPREDADRLRERVGKVRFAVV